jgi:hypothetical protein
VWALESPATQPHIDEHRVVVVDELDTRHPHAYKVEQSIEYSGRAHGL